MGSVLHTEKLKAYVSVNEAVVTQASYSSKTAVETYLQSSNLLESKKKLLHLSVINNNADEKTIINGIKDLVKE